jgi:hypothetical protein
MYEHKLHAHDFTHHIHSCAPVASAAIAAAVNNLWLLHRPDAQASGGRHHHIHQIQSPLHHLYL